MNNKKIYLMRPFTGEEELAAIRSVFESKHLTEGEVTKEFERKFAEYIGTGYAIATTSCMTAMVLALQSLGIKAGDEVIVPDFTHPATGDCVYQVGADAVLVDVNLQTYNIDPAQLEAAITTNTKCIIPVSWAGNPIDQRIYKIGLDYGIPIIEDAACSVGAMINDVKVGGFADVTCFSFHPRKVMTTGEGGMITTNNLEVAEKMIALKHFGQTHDGKFTYHGTNFKMSNIQAAIGIEQLKKLPKILDGRIKKTAYYSRLFKDVPNIRAPATTPSTRHTFQSYCIYIEPQGERDRLRSDLAKLGIETQIGTYALHLEPSYVNVKKVGSLLNSELLYSHLLALPLHHELTSDNQTYIVKTIGALMRSYRM